MIGRITSQPDNELFPSAAWRLLLPDPAPASIAAFGNGPAASTSRSIGGRFETSHDRPVALAVADDFHPATVAKLTARVQPGGAAYLQGRWAQGHGPNQITEDLHRAGFDAVRLYCLSIGEDRWQTSWFMPIGRPDVIRYLLDQRFPKSSPKPRAMVASAWRQIGRAMSERIARRPWLLFPRRTRQLCAVAVKSDGGTSTRAAPGLADRDGTGSTEATAVAMRIGGSSTDQPMLLLFGGGRPVPNAVVKVPDRSEELTASRHELRILGELAAPAYAVGSIPRPVELPTFPGIAALGQTAMPGRAMTAYASRERFVQLAETVTDWLIELAEATARPVERGWYRALIDSSISVLDGSMSNGSAVLSSVPQVGRLLDNYDPGVVVVAHRDLGPWNIVVDERGGIGVIDWAGAIRSGPPGCDLVHFLTHLALCATDSYQRPDRASVMRSLASTDTEFGAVAHRCLTRYFDRLEVDRPFNGHHLRVLTWTLAARRQAPDERPTSLYTGLLAAELKMELGSSHHRRPGSGRP